MTMIVFPRLDPPRCIFLNCAILFLPHFQNSLRYLKNSVDLNCSIWYRVKCIALTVPSTLLFTILFSGAYLWCLPNGASMQGFGYVLPISFFLCGIGYWESWVDKEHTNSIFHEVYEVDFQKDL